MPSGSRSDLTEPPFYLPQFEQAYRYIIDEYLVQPRETAIFIPCAVRKPYSQSPSQGGIMLSYLVPAGRFPQSLS